LTLLYVPFSPCGVKKEHTAEKPWETALPNHFFGRMASGTMQLLGFLEQLMALAHTQRVCSSCTPCTLCLPCP